MSRRPNRWESARDPHAARLRTPTRSFGPQRSTPTWSLPVSRALRILAVVIGLAFVWAYRAHLLSWWPL